jgi:hypothetical protein
MNCEQWANAMGVPPPILRNSVNRTSQISARFVRNRELCAEVKALFRLRKRRWSDRSLVSACAGKGIVLRRIKQLIHRTLVRRSSQGHERELQWKDDLAEIQRHRWKQYQ